MTLTYRDSIDGVDWEEMSALYRAAPLGDKSAAHLRTVFSNSRHVCLAYDGERLAGAGRVLADGADCAYLCDLAVLPAHQGSGLGRALIERLLEPVRGYRKVILYAVPGKEPFYRRFGFRRMTTAMAIFPEPDAMRARGYLVDD